MTSMPRQLAFSFRPQLRQALRHTRAHLRDEALRRATWNSLSGFAQACYVENADKPRFAQTHSRRPSLLAVFLSALQGEMLPRTRALGPREWRARDKAGMEQALTRLFGEEEALFDAAKPAQVDLPLEGPMGPKHRIDPHHAPF